MQNFDIGRVLSRAFSTIAQHPGPFAIVGFLLGALPLFPYMFLIGDGAASTSLPLLGIAGAVAVIVAVCAPMVMTIACIEISGQSAAGTPVDVRAALKRGVGAFFPLLGHAILWFIGFAFAYILLIVPGIIVACMWAVTFPALILERQGIIASFGRSRELTKGNR